MSNLKIADCESFEELDDADLAAVIGGGVVNDADTAVDDTVTNANFTISRSIDGTQSAVTLLTGPAITLVGGAV